MTSPRDATEPQLDAGVTLVEVVVAMLVFALIVSGIVAGMTTIARMTADNRDRVIAANLAAEQTDLARAIGDPFKITAYQGTQKFPMPNGGGNQLYYIDRTVAWVSSAGADISCGSSTNLFFLRVHVSVTWDGELPTTTPVKTDTVIAPAGLNGGLGTGTIAVYVVGADGRPVSGVAVSIVSSSGGAALSTQPAATGSDGCTYASKIAPGTYTVTLGKSGYVDPNQNASPSQSVVVSGGATRSVSFQYDQGTTYPVRYATNYPAQTPLLPTNLATTFIDPTSGMTITNTPAASVVLHPFSLGYTAVAGTLGTSAGTTTCAAVDPAAWPAASVNGTSLVPGQRGAGSAAGPGGVAAPISVTMGVIRVKSTGVGYLKAVQTDAGGVAKEPGCTNTATYDFGSALTKGSVDIALPFGTWTLYSGTALAQVTPIPGADLTALTNAARGEVTAGGVVTLDPRAAG